MEHLRGNLLMLNVASWTVLQFGFLCILRCSERGHMRCFQEQMMMEKCVCKIIVDEKTY